MSRREGVQTPQDAHDRRVFGDLAGGDAAADDDGVSGARLLKGGHLLDDHSVHRRHLEAGGRDGDAPAIGPDAVEHTERDQGVELV
ncbi:hypothetical protein [Streptomyces sp. NPDC048142]|uniref:hypothetical protein n=1 Tax=Streptomyces sp. NPDC048142 TaxID=3365501 RepID=UPI00371F75D7